MSTKSSQLITSKKKHRNDHAYSVSNSLRILKHKLVSTQDHVTVLKKRLKNEKKKVCRLQKKVIMLKTVVKDLKDKKFLSEQGLNVVQTSSDIPSELLKRLAKNKKGCIKKSTVC